MKKGLLLYGLLLVTFQLTYAQSSHKDSLNALVDTYYELNLKVFQKGSVVADIDNIFELFTDDFLYVHPKYGGTYSRQDLYDGYINNQANGSYDGKVIDIKVINQITGLNGVAVEKRFIERSENGTKEGKSELTVFQFRNELISAIYEYW